MGARTPRIGSVNGLERALITVTLVLSVVGVVAVASAAAPQAANNGSSIWAFMARDVAYLVIGLLVFVVACRFPWSKMSKLAVPSLVIAGALLVAVRVVGTSTSGGQRWISVGSMSIQPSELFTLSACFYLAFAIARTERTKREWKDVLILTIPVVAGAFAILAEPDMGTSSVLLIVTLMVLVLAGMPGRLIGALTASGIAAAAAFALSSPYRRARVLSFLHPGQSPGGAGYQQLQAKIAVGSGGWTGQGYGSGSAKWGLLPNPHTDFIFAVIGQELGFIGAAIIIALFVWLIILGMQTALRAPDRESQLLAGALTTWFAVEAIVNIASVVGWWPVTGIPLPFISYGGTSLVIDLAAVGLLVNVARRSTLQRGAMASKVAPMRASRTPARVVEPATRERRRSH